MMCAARDAAESVTAALVGRRHASAVELHFDAFETVAAGAALAAHLLVGKDRAADRAAAEARDVVESLAKRNVDRTIARR